MTWATTSPVELSGIRMGYRTRACHRFSEKRDTAVTRGIEMTGRLRAPRVFTVIESDDGGLLTTAGQRPAPSAAHRTRRETPQGRHITSSGGRESVTRW